MFICRHHAPVINCGSSNPSYYDSPSNHAFCSDLVDLLGPPVSVWAYGHTHWFHDMTINKTRIISSNRQITLSSNYNQIPKDTISAKTMDFPLTTNYLLNYKLILHKDFFTFKHKISVKKNTFFRQVFLYK